MPPSSVPQEAPADQWSAAPPAGSPGCAATPGPAVVVAFTVPECRLAYGEHLRVVGSCSELGGWDVAAAPALAWHEGHCWEASIAVPPGSHAFKLVVVGIPGGGGASCYRWELGPDRMLNLPHLAALLARHAADADGAAEQQQQQPSPVLRATCSGAFDEGPTALLRATTLHPVGTALKVQQQAWSLPSTALLPLLPRR